MHVINIFLSSPGDVADERREVEALVAELDADEAFNDCVLQCASWDREGHRLLFPAKGPLQDAVDHSLGRPGECDVVIGLLSARLGTPYTDSSGRAWPSGTAYELRDALDSSKRPEVLLLRREMRYPMSPEERPAFNEQLAHLEEFLKALDVKVNDFDIGGLREALAPTLKRVVRRLVDRRRNLTPSEPRTVNPIAKHPLSLAFINKTPEREAVEAQLRQGDALNVAAIVGFSDDWVDALAFQLQFHSPRVTFSESDAKDRLSLPWPQYRPGWFDDREAMAVAEASKMMRALHVANRQRDDQGVDVALQRALTHWDRRLVINYRLAGLRSMRELGRQQTLVKQVLAEWVKLRPAIDGHGQVLLLFSVALDVEAGAQRGRLSPWCRALEDLFDKSECPGAAVCQSASDVGREAGPELRLTLAQRVSWEEADRWELTEFVTKYLMKSEDRRWPHSRLQQALIAHS